MPQSHVSQLVPEHGLRVLLQVNRPDENPVHPTARLRDSHVQHEMYVIGNHRMVDATTSTNDTHQRQHSEQVSGERDGYTYYINVGTVAQPEARCCPFAFLGSERVFSNILIRRQTRQRPFNSCKHRIHSRRRVGMQGHERQQRTHHEDGQQHGAVQAVERLAPEQQPVERVEQRQRYRPSDGEDNECNHTRQPSPLLWSLRFRSARYCSSSASLTFSSCTSADTTLMYESPKKRLMTLDNRPRP